MFAYVGDVLMNIDIISVFSSVRVVKQEAKLLLG